MFGLDWRSLALMRIGLALVILADLGVSALNLRVFYTNDGVLPAQVVRENYAPDLSLYLAHGSVRYAAALFAVEAVFALMLLVGYRTRLATVGCLFLLLSRQARNPLVLFGADMIEHIALFWALWLPLNRRYSVDAWLGRVEPPKETRYLGMAGAGAVIQFILIYLVSGLAKTGSSWHVTNSAVYYALSIQIYARPLGQWLNQYDWLTAWLTVGTLYLELYGPVLFILPIRRGWGRLLGFALFGLLQLGFGLCMQMGLFWVVMNVFMLMLLPESFWTGLAEPLGRWCGQRLGWAANNPPPSAAAVAAPLEQGRWQRRGKMAWTISRETTMAGIIVYMLLLNYDTLRGHEPVLPSSWHRPAVDSGLEQCFDMFAPDPQQFDGWYVVRGLTQSGREVDVRTGETPPDFSQPSFIADTYGNERWCSYLLDLAYNEFAAYRPYYADYLARQWNAQHLPSEQLTQVEIVFMRSIHALNHAADGPTPTTLWMQDY